MSLALAVDSGLALLVLAVASWTIAVRDAFAAVIGFVAYGLLLALIWVRLAAPDVALTEAAMGSGLTGLLLLGAAARLRGAQARPAPLNAVQQWGTGALCALIAVGLAAIVLLLPDPGPSLAPAAVMHLPSTGLGNPVTGVLLAYRAIDTLLEAIVLLPALLGVWSLAPDRYWGGAPILRHPRPDGALTLLAQVLPPFGIIVGIYLCWNGADKPGGAFQGGAVLAAMWVLILLARQAEVPPVSRRGPRLLLVVGSAVFLAIGLAGMWFADAFLGYPAGYAKPLIVMIELVLTLSIAVALGLLIAGPPARLPS
jgi:multisubunit Na+/H+ antiporter MnhB subunit